MNQRVIQNDHFLQINWKIETESFLAHHGDVRLGEEKELAVLFADHFPKYQNCVVELESEVGSATLVRALFGLWKAVNQAGGTLICVGYPKDYIAGVDVLGIKSLDKIHFLDSLRDE